MNRKLVFWTALNSYQSPKLLRDKPPDTVHPVLTMEWTERRIGLFNRFTLPSILNQRYEDFLFIVLLDPKLKHLTKPLLPSRPDNRVIYCYRDKATLARVREHDEITFALIDGDDMYGRDAGLLMMACQDEWMYFRRGYALDVLSNQLFGYDTIGTGPFWAQRIDPKRIRGFDREKRHPAHPNVILQNPTQLEDGNFCVLIHDVNTSSRMGMKYVQDQVTGDQDRRLRQEYGI